MMVEKVAVVLTVGLIVGITVVGSAVGALNLLEELKLVQQFVHLKEEK
jgi:hypothetical protein